MQNKLKKTISLMLIITMVVGFFPLTSQAINYGEMSSWAYEEVTLAISNNLIGSRLQKNYKDDIIRQDFATLVVSIIEATEEKSIDQVIIDKIGRSLNQVVLENPFIDTNDKNVIAAYSLGIINGISQKQFAPKDKISREQAAALLTRTASFLGEDTEVSSYKFADNSSIASFAKDDIAYVSQKGIMQGIGNNSFAPKANYSREQAYITINRLYSIVKKDRNKDISYEADLPVKAEFVLQSIYIGQAEDKLISHLGLPSRKDLSEYGFYWYIYNGNYKNYIQVGVKNKKVVAIYTNADNWISKQGLKIGSPRQDVEKILGTIVREDRKDEIATFLVDNSYVRAYFDIYKDQALTALLIIDKKTADNFTNYYASYSQDLRNGFEYQMLDLVNAIRVREGLHPLDWSELSKISSRKHSQDMADNDYFEHNSQDGTTPFERMKKEGIIYNYAGENISAGYPNPIESHQGLLNSYGHRVNILSENFKKLGVGVGYGKDSYYKYYYTQNFYSER
ncbi:MAG: CAP-associated domain-containing protein [Tissierellaceae bacterium]